MALPHGFLDDLASRVSIAKIIGQKVAWDPRKSNPSRGEYWGLCPFHQEKTPSFKVDDQKGFYICFGCHAKGDAIKFLRETGNIGFMDAVAILARDVGMTIPAPDPEARKAADRRALLEDAVEAALTFFRLQLQSSRGAAARNYLRDRGLEDATLAQFEIGYAPEGGSPLHQFLAGRNIPPDVMIDAGLVIRPDDGGKPYDRFRDRIMFPIRHPRGACIGFGGRAMNPKVPAKYINSPETPLFDKGRTLYNFGPAREAAGKSGDLVVVEGYMDVIALVASGVENAVAPLGTAITAGQLELMWRASAEPVITLDGDEAGRRAALRLMDLALPLLKAGRSLRFVMLPEGTDPDDLIRQGGRDAMRHCLADSRPMVDLLWQRETEGRVFDSPERRASLDKALRDALSRIGDNSIRSHYHDALRQLRKQLFGFDSPAGRAEKPAGKHSGPRPGGRSGPRSLTRGTRQSAAATGTRTSPLAAKGASGQASTWGKRESVLLAAAILNPVAAARPDAGFETWTIRTPRLRDLHGRIAALISEQDPDAIDPVSFRKDLSDQLGHDPMDKLRKEPGVLSNPCFSDTADPSAVERTFLEAMELCRGDAGVEQEAEEAMRDMATAADESLTYRIRQAAVGRDRARQETTIDTIEDDEEKDLSRQLQSNLDNQIWKKRKRQ